MMTIATRLASKHELETTWLNDSMSVFENGEYAGG